MRESQDPGRDMDHVSDEAELLQQPFQTSGQENNVDTHQLLLVWWLPLVPTCSRQCCACTNAHFPWGLQFAFPISSSGIDFFSFCCPLPLAVDDADFMSNVLLRFGSASIGLSLESRAADAAGSGSGIAASVSSLLFSFCSPQWSCAFFCRL